MGSIELFMFSEKSKFEKLELEIRREKTSFFRNFSLKTDPILDSKILNIYWKSDHFLKFLTLAWLNFSINQVGFLLFFSFNFSFRLKYLWLMVFFWYLPSQKVPSKEAISQKVPSKEAISQKVPSKEAISQKVPSKEAVSQKVPSNFQGSYFTKSTFQGSYFTKSTFPGSYFTKSTFQGSYFFPTCFVLTSKQKVKYLIHNN
jgi:hypothetical protein